MCQYCKEKVYVYHMERCKPVTMFVTWLAPRAGKMKRILCSDWLSERARWAYLARSGSSALFSAKAKFFGVIFWPYKAGHVDIGPSVFCVFMDLDFVFTLHKNAKKIRHIS